MKKILIVEEDKVLSNGLVQALHSVELEIVQCTLINSARNLLPGEAFDLIVLNTRLPDGSGLELLRELRERWKAAVILLTEADEEIALGVELGADDYLSKPFELESLRSRVHTQLRKIAARDEVAQAVSNGSTYVHGDFSFELDRMEFVKGGKYVELSKTEQRLLKLLVANRGIAMQKSVLVDRIWGDTAERVSVNTLSVVVKRLRNKVEDDIRSPKYIKTIHGIGYKWEDK